MDYDLTWYLGTTFGKGMKPRFDDDTLDEEIYMFYLAIAQAEMVDILTNCPDLYENILQLQLTIYLQSHPTMGGDSAMSIDSLDMVGLVKKDAVGPHTREYEFVERNVEITEAQLPNILTRMKSLCSPRVKFGFIALGHAPCDPCSGKNRMVDQTTQGVLEWLMG